MHRIRFAPGFNLGPLVVLDSCKSYYIGHSHGHKFVDTSDDTSLLDVVDNPESSSERLNHDLSKLNTWASQWLVNFNPSKTVVMTFSTRGNHLLTPQQS